MAIPIIFVHLNNQLFLLNVLLEAKKSNPKSKIYLIGDETNSHYDFVKHVHYKDLIDEDYNKFIQIYENMSPNSFEGERFCFLRWFLIRELIKKENLGECFCVDSDVLILQDLERNLIPYKNFDLAISDISGHNCYINNYNAIVNFCKFMLEMYDSKNLNKLRDLYAELPSGCGVCDMTLLDLYRKEHPEKVANLQQIIDGKTFDHNIKVQQGFEMKDGIKNLKNENGKVVCKNIELNQNVEFITLHFQGPSKNLIRRYSSVGKLKLILLQLKYNTYLYFKHCFRGFLRKLKIKN